jgi:hypothetical protein
VQALGTGDSPQFTDLTLTGKIILSAGTAPLPSLTPSGDPNTGMWFPAADTIAWSAGGSERMRIASDGNIGIGATNPSNKIDIYQNANVAVGVNLGNNQSTWQFGNAIGGNFVIYSNNAKSIIFSNNATQRMLIDASGNVGIGTSTFGTSAARVLSLGIATAPSTGPADTLQIYSSDLSAGNTMLSLWTEGTVVNSNVIASTTHRIAVRVNGTIYYLLADTSP